MPQWGGWHGSREEAVNSNDFNFFFFNVYFCVRERQSMNGGGAEREGDTESEAGSRL